MKKFRRVGWFLFLVVLLAGLAGLSVAQETPNAVDKHLTQRAGRYTSCLSPVARYDPGINRVCRCR